MKIFGSNALKVIPGLVIFTGLLFPRSQVSFAETAEWPQFRGPGGNAIAENQSIPLTFGPEDNVRWKTPLPPGHSSPCIWDDRIFLTGHDGTLLKMICLRRSDGKILWEQEREIAGIPRYEHVAGDPANPTPATDGNRVVFFFDDPGLIVTDMDGSILWEKKLPSTGNDYSYGASPILDRGRIYLNLDGGIASSLVCFDAATGDEIWSAPRPEHIVSFCTPYVLEHQGARLILAGGSGRLDAYDAETGASKWTVGSLPIFLCPSPVAAEDMVVFGGWTTAHAGGQERIQSAFDEKSGVSPEAMRDPDAFFAQFDKNQDGKLTVDEFPESRARDAFNFIDKNRDGFVEMDEWAPAYENKPAVPGRNVMLGIATGGSGDITGTHVRWALTRGLPYVASPLAYRGRVYLVATGGFVTCVDTATGKPIFQKERLGVGGEYFATPVAVGEHIIVCAQRGTVFLIQVGDQLKVILRADLGEALFATPAAVDDTLYIRSENHLWAFGG